MDWDSEFSLSGTQSEALEWRSAVANLNRIVENERRSPELLSFERSIVSQVEAILREQIFHLESRRAEDREIYQFDIDRVTYMLKMYYRVRLMKLNTFHRHYSRNNTESLSESEITLVQKLNFLEQKHLTDSFLHCLPEGSFQSVEKDQDMSMVAVPSLDHFCFYRALDHVGNLAIDVGTITIEKNIVYLGKYSHIRSLLNDKRLELL